MPRAPAAMTATRRSGDTASPEAKTPGLAVASLTSAGGKTTVSLALMAALEARGYTALPFKTGPDYIDPLHHAALLGRPGQNLDGWMLGREICQAIVQRAFAGVPGAVAVVETAMGLFDGAHGEDDEGSGAQIARWLGLPVLLVVSAEKMGRTAAALIAGIAAHDPRLVIGGVLFNRVASPGHARLLAEAMRVTLPKMPVFGFLPRDPRLAIPERHLGLTLPGDAPPLPRAALVSWLEENADLERLIAVFFPAVSPASPPLSPAPPLSPTGNARTRKKPRLAIARDAAFQFLYQENLRLLAEAGFELAFFSPLRDSRLPRGAAGIYLCGGYPELAARELSANAAMRREIAAFAASGSPLYAECGGMMYLGRTLRPREGAKTFTMAGVLPLHFAMRAARRALGYRAVRLLAPSWLGRPGAVIRGHEFHYSDVCAQDEALPALFAAADRDGAPLGEAGCVLGSTAASYIHLHFGSCPQLAYAFARSCGVSCHEETPA